jgi:small-conductance mechanosensitive channel
MVLLGLLGALAIALPSFNAGELVQLLGISSVAIGFAFRDILQNLLAGILILLTEPFKTGDQIIVNDFEGTVEHIETRATFIRTYDGRGVVIPNADMFTQSVTVNTAHPLRRTHYDVGIGYGDDAQKAADLMIEAMKEVDGVVGEPAPEVLVWDLAGSSVNLRARWWTESRRRDVTTIKGDVLTAITAKLSENGIDMPFPTQVILFHDQTEETDGDRNLQREGWPVTAGDPPAPLTIAGSIRELTQALAGRER